MVHKAPMQLGFVHTNGAISKQQAVAVAAGCCCSSSRSYFVVLKRQPLAAISQPWLGSCVGSRAAYAYVASQLRARITMHLWFNGGNGDLCCWRLLQHQHQQAECACVLSATNCYLVCEVCLAPQMHGVVTGVIMYSGACARAGT
jgi:hypothetical protein